MNATTALKSCYIENDDALKVMQRWSTKQTLFYLDPPYVSCESYYEYNKTRGKDAAIELHYNLASLANSIECAGIVLSYYPNELLDELYPEEFWERHYKSVLASSAGITRTSKNQNRPERTELLLVRKKTNTEIKANYQGQLSLL
jgi:site-specific DNA-adenine methylase